MQEKELNQQNQLHNLKQGEKPGKDLVQIKGNYLKEYRKVLRQVLYAVVVIGVPLFLISFDWIFPVQYDLYDSGSSKDRDLVKKIVWVWWGVVCIGMFSRWPLRQKQIVSLKNEKAGWRVKTYGVPGLWSGREFIIDKNVRIEDAYNKSWVYTDGYFLYGKDIETGKVLDFYLSRDGVLNCQEIVNTLANEKIVQDASNHHISPTQLN